MHHLWGKIDAFVGIARITLSTVLLYRVLQIEVLMTEKQRAEALSLHKKGLHKEKTSSIEGRLRLLQVAGGDPDFAAKLCEMLWHEYRAAGCPLGVSEEGMFRWLMQEE